MTFDSVIVTTSELDLICLFNTSSLSGFHSGPDICKVSFCALYLSVGDPH